jgi:hypothetical protein
MFSTIPPTTTTTFWHLLAPHPQHNIISRCKHQSPIPTKHRDATMNPVSEYPSYINIATPSPSEDPSCGERSTQIVDGSQDLPLIPIGCELSRSHSKPSLQPWRVSRLKVHHSAKRVSSAAVVSPGDHSIVHLTKGSFLREDQFIFNTPKPSSRQSIFGKHLRPSALPMNLLMMPPLHWENQ